MSTIAKENLSFSVIFDSAHWHDIVVEDMLQFTWSEADSKMNQ